MLKTLIKKIKKEVKIVNLDSLPKNELITYKDELLYLVNTTDIQSNDSKIEIMAKEEIKEKRISKIDAFDILLELEVKADEEDFFKILEKWNDQIDSLNIEDQKKTEIMGLVDIPDIDSIKNDNNNDVHRQK